MAPEQRDEKARIILDAARRTLARKGYMATTISLVAAEAGVSRGLLHYYFKNKEEMLAQVVRENMQISVEMIETVFQTQESAQGIARGITALLRTVMTEDPDFFHLFFEGIAVARQSQVVNHELSTLYGQFRLALETCLDRAAAAKIISPALPSRPLAAILTGIIDGMGLQLLTEPDLRKEAQIFEGMEGALADLLVSQA